MDSGVYLTFGLLALSMTVAPGPNLFIVIHHTVSGNTTQGGAAIAGICFSLCLHAVLALIGFSMLLTSSPEVFLLVKMAGAIYLMYLGVQALRIFCQASRIAILEKGQIVPMQDLSKAFRDGFFVGILNPYTAIFILTITPQFLVDSQHPLTLSLGVLIATIALIKIVWFGSVAVMLSKLSTLIRSDKFARYLNLFSGIVLVIIGANMIRSALM